MIRDPFDIDKFFREIERQIDLATSGYGGYKYDHDNHSSNIRNDNLLEDRNNIYITVDINMEPDKVEAKIENNNELVVILNNGYERIKLPADVEKVESVTCVNGIIDIVIRKKMDGKQNRKD